MKIYTRQRGEEAASEDGEGAGLVDPEEEEGGGVEGREGGAARHMQVSYRDSVTRFFASDFFHESSSPKPLKK